MGGERKAGERTGRERDLQAFTVTAEEGNIISSQSISEDFLFQTGSSTFKQPEELDEMMLEL